MGVYKKYLKNVRALKFFRLLGTGGKTGFLVYIRILIPIVFYLFGKIKLMQIILKLNRFFFKISKKANKISVYHLIPFQSIGKWAGINPFSDNFDVFKI